MTNLKPLITAMLIVERVKECMSDSVTNYNYVGYTKISVAIKKY